MCGYVVLFFFFFFYFFSFFFFNDTATTEIYTLSLHDALPIFKISDYKIYRIFPSGEVQYLHPKDGVFPEKVNAGRTGVGNINHSIGKNTNPVNVKFTNKNVYD